MPIGWITLLKSVPWANVISSAPIVADSAKKLWKTVRQPSSTPPQTTNRTPGHDSEPDTIAALRHRLAMLEAAQENLHKQMLASSELIRDLAEQNAQLVRKLEAQRRQLLWLAGIGGAVLLVIVLLLALR